MTTLISSQRYLDDDTVMAKREAKDYVVTLSPEFEINGETVQAIIDGHHSLAAAEQDGVTPEYAVATAQDDDRVILLDDGSIDDYLLAAYADAPWYDYETKVDLF